MSKPRLTSKILIASAIGVIFGLAALAFGAPGWVAAILVVVYAIGFATVLTSR